MQAIAPIPRRPLHEEAVERLRELIVHHALSPGERRELPGALHKAA